MGKQHRHPKPHLLDPYGGSDVEFDEDGNEVGDPFHANFADLVDEGFAVSPPPTAELSRPFRRPDLMSRGFEGFRWFKDLDLERVPDVPGVYVVLRERDDRPRFLERNPAGWFKGKDPTVPVAELETAWPDSAHCVYIGKAATGTRGRRHLRQRIKEFRRYGDGEPVGHQGGRRIWQLVDADYFVLAWLRTDAPEEMEGDLLHEFVALHGVRPIGNRTTGRRR